jgi:hypothetical protein
MERRKFLFFLPSLIAAPKVFVEVMTSVPVVGQEVSELALISGETLGFTEAQMIANELARVYVPLPSLFERDDVFYSAIERTPLVAVSSRMMRVPLQLKPGGQFGANPIILLEDAINRKGRKIKAAVQKVADDLTKDIIDLDDDKEGEDPDEW